MDFRNPKLVGSIAASLMLMAWLSLRVSDSTLEPLSESQEKNEEISFDMKTTSFELPPPRKEEKPQLSKVPAWGSFKTLEQPKAVTESKQTQETLKKIAALVAKKQKEAKKKKLAQKKKQKRKNMLAKNASKTERAKRFVDDGWKSNRDTPPQVLVIAQPIPKKNDTKQEEENTRTLAEWRSLLVDSPHPEETDRLVEEYTKGNLGSPEWFYLLTREMLESRDSKVRSEGVRALNSTPSLQSFSMLVGAKESVREEDTQIEIKASLDQYAALPDRMPILSQGLLHEIEVVRQASTELIDKSATLAFTKVGRKSRSGTLPSPHAPYYTNVLPILEAVSQKDVSEDVRRSALTAMETIQRYTNQTSNTRDGSATAALDTMPN